MIPRSTDPEIFGSEGSWELQIFTFLHLWIPAMTKGCDFATNHNGFYWFECPKPSNMFRAGPSRAGPGHRAGPGRATKYKKFHKSEPGRPGRVTCAGSHFPGRAGPHKISGSHFPGQAGSLFHFSKPGRAGPGRNKIPGRVNVAG